MKLLAAPRTGLLAAVAVTAFALFMLLQFNHAWYYIPFSDDVWMATTAKNWAQGYGWATSYGEVYLFDPFITTGPGLLGVIALAIKLLGNQIWIPRVISLALNLSLFALLLRRLYLHLPRTDFFWVLLLLSFMYGSVNSYMWMTSLGDLTAFLYVVLTAMFMHEALEAKRLSLFAASGMFAGLALLTKLVAMVALCGLIPLLLLYLFCVPSVSTISQRIKRLLPGIVVTASAIALVMMPWFLYQHLTVAGMSPDEQTRLDMNFKYHFATSGSGLNILKNARESGDIIGHLSRTVQTNFIAYHQSLSSMLRPLTGFFPVFIGTSLLLSITAFCQRDQRINRLQLSFLLPALAYMAWLLAFSQFNYGRFVSVGLFIGFIGIAIGLCRAPLLSALLTLYMVFSLILFRPVYFGIGPLYQWESGTNPIATALHDIVTTLERDYSGKTLVSCSNIYSREVDYALIGVNRVIDCRYQLGTVLAFDEQQFFKRYPALEKDGHISGLNIFLDNKLAEPQSNLVAPVKWTGTTEFIVVSNPMGQAFKKFGMAAQYDAFVPQCREKLYDNGYYALHLCRQQELEAALALKGGMELVPMQWQWQSWLNEAKSGHR